MPRQFKCVHCKVKSPVRGNSMEQRCEVCNGISPCREVRDGEITTLLDWMFSVYVRRSYAKRGICKCVTCGCAKSWRDMQAGHWIKRGHFGVRWDTRNVHPQCPRCNGGFGRARHAGEPEKYRKFIERTYGEDVPAELVALSNNGKPNRAAKLAMCKDLYEKNCELGLLDHMVDNYRKALPAPWVLMLHSEGK